MSKQVTLTLSNELYERARQWATLTQRDLSGALTDALTVVLTPLPTATRPEKRVSALTDEEVLALSQARMKATPGQRLGELLEKQREGNLAESERPELLALMQAYNQIWIRQSEALAEAVRRGLRPPLEP